MVMGKNVMITGAAGFLGSHLTIHHLKAGDNVLGLDNYSSSREDSRHSMFVRKMYSPERAMIRKVDICSTLDVVAAVDDFITTNGGKIDLIYNFACPASPPRYQEIPVETLLTCTAGTVNILDVARKHNSVFVHASTSEVYGDPDVSPQSESYKGNVNSYGPRSCYDEGKRAAEALCYDYLHKHGVDARLVRIFNTYGENMDPLDGRVVSNFIVQALKRQPYTIYGGGKQTRSFCYVSDLIRGITTLAGLSKNPGVPINLGNPAEFTVMDLALLVNRLLYGATKPELINMPLPKDDPLQRRPDISRAKEILGWEPTVDLEEGVRRTIKWFMEELSSVN
jgi:UDP-glucuronate decarboxylase